MLTDTAVFRKSIATLPLKIYQAGETVLAAGYTTGQLLILRKGLVAVTKEGVEIARVTDPGAVFGEISALEDSTNGLRAAAAAGMVVIASPNRAYPPEPDAVALAALVVKTVD